MNFIKFLLLISASQGFIFGTVVLFSPFFKTKYNNYLSYSILVLSLLMLNMFLDNIGFFNTYPKLSIIDDIEWIFLFPVTFFYYSITLITHKLEKSKKLKWLFVPLLMSVILNVVVDLEKDYKAYTIIIDNKEQIFSGLFDIEEISYYIFNLVLLIWSNVLIKRLDELYDNNQLKWIKSVWRSVFVLTVIWIVLALIEEEIIEEGNPEVLVAILSIGLSFFMYWIFYNGIYKLKLATDQKEILDILNKKNFSLRDDQIYAERELLNNKKTKIPDDIDETTTGFSRDNIHFMTLELLIYDEFIYRDQDLNREIVAEKLGISSGYLSQIVNSITDKNFTSYINHFRIQEAKQMIIDPEFDKYSLTAIGLEAGFKSKTTFYKVFKKETGLTPSEFKKQ